jgi:hypothetical protein
MPSTPNPLCDFIFVVSKVDPWRSSPQKLIGLMTGDDKKRLEGPVRDCYLKTVPMLMRNSAFGIHNPLRRLFYWYRALCQPMVSPQLS